ncbi:phosphoglycerate mutase [Malacoplasma penetrans HF-2]|uniref:phosphoglycerate mutase (2,3-diphosphoglycerate-independent) n=1 Tax=Malacoplasma penetrans (strain HF-2) TaxID=272633 RepID=Q8EX30_MALP2|nr:phosphoglycerate mutase [Malacoplasma penetrans]BAC43810.1 phosphoglycerate mutase [Malacoplasma penetrans HF-2]
MKNTLIFLVTEGIGLNKKWKGNYLKLANKPNINYLISGIYPWALLSNDRKRNKYIPKKTYPSVKRDVDSNFYEMLYGETDIKTYLELLDEQIKSKSLHNLEIFNKLIDRSNKTNSKIVHIFSMLSFNENKFNAKNLFYVINVLIKKGLKPVLHLIADGQDERPYSFNKNLSNFSKFLLKRNTPIVTVAGRNHVFGKKGRDFLDNEHVMDYFETICGLGEQAFTEASEYTNENLANKVMDADILPAYNTIMDGYFVSKDDSVLFLNSDPDDFASLARMMKTSPKLKGLFLSSLAPIYGTKLDAVFFENPVKGKEESLLANMVAKNDNKVLVLGLNHKKGFINKFFGENTNNENITRKILSSPACTSDKEYFSLSSKMLIDKTIDSIGKYDVIFVMCPMIAEAARSSDLKQLLSTIETFDQHLGRLINLCRCTGNIIALTSAYGAAEKMLDKHLNIVPHNKSSLVPFVFTNGDLWPKKMQSNFLGVYSSILSTLDSLDTEHKLFYTSLIDPNFTKSKIEESLNDMFLIWKETISDDLIKSFEDNKLNFYSEFSKDEQFLSEKQKYVVLKEIIEVNKKVLLTPEARKKLYNVLIDYVEYNKIDFVGLDINYKKTFQTLFDKEIKMLKLSKLSNKYFDKKIWITNFVRNDEWINSIKFDLLESSKRTFDVDKNEKFSTRVYNEMIPFLFFEKIRKSEVEILKTNDAVSIAQFYELIKEEVRDIFEQYILDKLPVESEDATDEVVEEEKSPEQIATEKAVHSISVYFDYFVEVVDLIRYERDYLESFNRRYKETQEHLAKQNKIYDSTDIFNVPEIALNPLTAKIVSLIRLYKSELKSHAKTEKTENKKTIYKFDMAYSTKIDIAKQSIAYDGEFNEEVNLKKQDEFEKKFAEYVEVYKEFDNTVIEWESDEEKDDEYSMDDETIEYDENGNPIMVDKIDTKIKTRPEYDLTEVWVQKRIDEYNNVDNYKPNIAVDAIKQLDKNKQTSVAKARLRDYSKLSEVWKKTAQSETENNG